MVGRPQSALRAPAAVEGIPRGRKALRAYPDPPEQFWADKQIDLRLGRNVGDVDLAHELGLSDDTRIGYRKLIWAAGGDARRMSCPGDYAGIRYIRTRRGVDASAKNWAGAASARSSSAPDTSGRGRGATTRKLDCKVTVVEMLDRVLARVAGPQLSEFYAAYREQGVDLRLSTGVETIEGENGRVTGVVTDSGERIADVVIAGIGIVPSVGPLIAAGAGSEQVDIDSYCRTTLDDIYAIGDCASHANCYADNKVIH